MRTGKLRKTSGGTLLLSLLLLTLWSPAFVRAQPGGDVSAFWESEIPPESGWTVGDPVKLNLRVTAPPGGQVTFPELPESWGDFEIQSQTILPPEEQGGKVTYRVALTVVLWEPGEHETPATTVTYRDKAGDHEIRVIPLSVSIASVLSEATPDAEGQIEKRDLKPQETLPGPPLWPWILGGLLALPLLYLAGRWLWRRLPRRGRTSQAAEIEPVDPRLPEEIAYETLDAIATMDLPANGAFKEHYTRVTDCLRTYIEGLYAVPALDRTTFELVGALRAVKLKGEPLTLVRELLSEADLVKFARFTPTVEPARDAVARARRFVDSTKPERGVNET